MLLADDLIGLTPFADLYQQAKSPIDDLTLALQRHLDAPRHPPFIDPHKLAAMVAPWAVAWRDIVLDLSRADLS